MTSSEEERLRTEIESFEQNAERLKRWLFESLRHPLTHDHSNDNSTTINHHEQQQQQQQQYRHLQRVTDVSSPIHLKHLIQKYCDRSQIREIQVAFEVCHSERYRAYFTIGRDQQNNNSNSMVDKIYDDALPSLTRNTKSNNKNNKTMNIKNNNIKGSGSGGGRIVLCTDKIKTKHELETVLTHELMHMFDHCAWRANFREEEQLTCSELRASAVGECVSRRNLYKENDDNNSTMDRAIGSRSSSLREQEQCARMHAIRNMQGYGHTRQKSEELVRKMFHKCYHQLLLNQQPQQ